MLKLEWPRQVSGYVDIPFVSRQKGSKNAQIFHFLIKINNYLVTLIAEATRGKKTKFKANYSFLGYNFRLWISWILIIDQKRWYTLLSIFHIFPKILCDRKKSLQHLMPIFWIVFVSSWSVIALKPREFWTVSVKEEKMCAKKACT